MQLCLGGRGGHGLAGDLDGAAVDTQRDADRFVVSRGPRRLQHGFDVRHSAARENEALSARAPIRVVVALNRHRFEPGER